MCKPSWDDAPDWAEWLAQDGNGDWWFFEEKPEIIERGIGHWDCPGSMVHVFSKERCANWRETLERRPESTEAGKLHVTIDASEARKVIDEALEASIERVDPDLIIPKDAAEQIGFPTIVADLADAGYRLEIDSTGIRGWKER